MSQVFAPQDGAAAESISQEFYIPISGPVVGILSGYPVTFTSYNAGQNLPEVNAYADGSRGFVGITMGNYPRLGTGFVQVAGESVLMLAARCDTALTIADAGEPLYSVSLGGVSLTRVAATDPLIGVISYVDAGTGDFKVIIEQDKPPSSGGAGMTDWVAEDDSANTLTVNNGYILEFNGNNGISTDASVANVMTLSLPTPVNDETGLYYDLTTATWKPTERIAFGTTSRIQLDCEGNLPSGFPGDCGVLSETNGAFGYSNNFIISTGSSGVANLWISGNGANASSNIYFSAASVSGDYPLPATYNQITSTALATSAQAIVLSTGIGTARPTDSGTEVALYEGNTLQVGTSSRTSSTGGKNLNDTSKYGGSQNNTVGGLLTFGNGSSTTPGSGYVSGSQQTEAATDGTVATAAEYYLGAASTVGSNIDQHSCFRVYRLTLSMQNSTDSVYQTETITIVSDLATATWSVSDFLSTGGAASEIAWDVDFPTPAGSTLTYMRVRPYSTLVGKNVQFDISGQAIGGNLI